MTAVFLDLDGTLMESHPGILASLRHALESAGHHALAEIDLSWMIGPPLDGSLRRMGLSDPEPVIAEYRAHYRETGMFNARVYDGVLDALDALRKSRARLYVATAKPHVYARQITRHFGLAKRMEREFGPELDGTRQWKGDLLAYALADCGQGRDGRRPGARHRGRQGCGNEECRGQLGIRQRIGVARCRGRNRSPGRPESDACGIRAVIRCTDSSTFVSACGAAALKA